MDVGNSEILQPTEQEPTEAQLASSWLDSKLLLKQQRVDDYWKELEHLAGRRNIKPTLPEPRLDLLDNEGQIDSTAWEYYSYNNQGVSNTEHMENLESSISAIRATMDNIDEFKRYIESGKFIWIKEDQALVSKFATLERNRRAREEGIRNSEEARKREQEAVKEFAGTSEVIVKIREAMNNLETIRVRSHNVADVSGPGGWEIDKFQGLYENWKPDQENNEYMPRFLFANFKPKDGPDNLPLVSMEISLKYENSHISIDDFRKLEGVPGYFEPSNPDPSDDTVSGTHLSFDIKDGKIVNSRVERVIARYSRLVEDPGGWGHWSRTYILAHEPFERIEILDQDRFDDVRELVDSLSQDTREIADSRGRKPWYGK